MLTVGAAELGLGPLLMCAAGWFLLSSACPRRLRGSTGFGWFETSGAAPTGFLGSGLVL